MPLGDVFKKAAGLFVEFDQTTPTPAPLSDDEFRAAMNAPVGNAPAPTQVKTVEQIVREQPGPNLDEIKIAPEVVKAAQPMRPDGTVDYAAIYQMASVPSAAFSAEQILELLASLPAELPIDARRQTVKITLEAMAKTVPVTPQAVVADASRKLAALASYASGYSKQADDFASKTDLEIAALQLQIADKQKAIEDAKAQQTAMVEACRTESGRLDDILEFFSLDVAPSKYAK